DPLPTGRSQKRQHHARPSHTRLVLDPRHDRDLYPFVYDLNGVNFAHGARPVLIGKDLMGLKDQDGVYLIQEMVKIANGPGSGWVNYKWPNPLTNKIEDKTSYVEKMGNYFVGVGAYRK